MKENLPYDELNDLFHIQRLRRRNNPLSFGEDVSELISIRLPIPDEMIASVIAKESVRHSGNVTVWNEPMPFYLLLVMKEGKAELEIDNNKFLLKPDIIFLISPEQQFHIHTNSSSFSYDIYFLTGRSLESYCQKLFTLSGLKSYMKNCDEEYIFLKLSEISQVLRFSEEYSVFLISSYLIDIFSFLIKKETGYQPAMAVPDYVIQARKLLEEDYEEPYSLDYLSDKLKVEKYRFCHDFTNYVGISPIQYLNNIRIMEAKQLLHEQNIPIHEIGEIVGIPNTTHFINLFKKRYGTTPLKYRLTVSQNEYN